MTRAVFLLQVRHGAQDLHMDHLLVEQLHGIQIVRSRIGVRGVHDDEPLLHDGNGGGLSLEVLPDERGAGSSLPRDRGCKEFHVLC